MMAAAAWFDSPRGDGPAIGIALVVGGFLVVATWLDRRRGR